MKETQKQRNLATLERILKDNPFVTHVFFTREDNVRVDIQVSQAEFKINNKPDWILDGPANPEANTLKNYASGKSEAVPAPIEELEVPPRPSEEIPPPPPIDNAHVAPGAELFTSPVIPDDPTQIQTPPSRRGRKNK